MSLFAELKRRNVFRASATYLALGWVVTQVTSTVAPALHLPDWIVPVVVWIGVIGFPFVVVFSWVFELTPEGLRRERDVADDVSIKHVTARRLDHLAIGLFSLAIVLLAADRFFVRGSAPAPATAPVAAPAKDAGAAASVVPSEKSAPPASEKSIAVLPFADLSPGHDQEYFSDGMAEEILDALAQVRDLKVAGRTSSFFFKGKNETLQAIGAALGVAHVLEGSVRTQGTKVRITAQLIQTRDGFHLWSQSYDGDLSDVFQLQERIAHAITDQLQVVLEGGQKLRLAQKRTPSAEAHQQYLRGRYFWNARGIVNLQDAVTAFKAALAADPDYAEAWAGLAQTYALLPEYSVLDPASSGRIDSVALALEAANRALQLEPDSSAALLARAYVRTMFQFDWFGAEADFRAAIAGNVRDPGARHWYAELLMYQRRWPEAAVQYDAALANDPLRPITHLSRALSFWFQGKPEASLPDFDESLRLAPGFHYSTMEKTKVLAQLRRFDEAAAAARTLPAGEREVMLSFIAALQDPSKREAAIQQIVAHGPGGVIGRPILFALLGRNDLTLAELERLFAEKDPYRVFVYMIPAFDPLRGDPRFQVLVRQVNLPPPTQGKAENP